MVHVVVQHCQHGLENEVAGRYGDQTLGHNVADGCFGRQRFGNSAGTQVAIGDDTF